MPIARKYSDIFILSNVLSMSGKRGRGRCAVKVYRLLLFILHFQGAVSTLKGLEASSKVLDGIGRIAKPVAIATDDIRIVDAIVADGGTVGKNTVTTSASVAGGWAGAWG